MPLDRPTYPGEKIIPLADYVVTNYLANNPALALDDNDETHANFNGTLNVSETDLYSFLNTNGSCHVQAARLLLVSGGTSQAGSVWSVIDHPAGAFRVTFRFVLTRPRSAVPGGTLESASPSGCEGFCFVIQYDSNSTVAGTRLGAAGSGLGYQSIPNSVALKFDVRKQSSDASDNTVGIFTGGAAPVGGQVIGIDLASGNPIDAVVVYDGTTLTLDLSDLITGATGHAQFTVDIPTAVGNPDARFGFTGSTGTSVASRGIPQILSFYYQASTDPDSDRLRLFDVPLRYLRVHWGDDRWVSRVRLKVGGDAALNFGVALESSLGEIQTGADPPPDIFLPVETGPDTYEVQFDPLYLAEGIVFYPDHLLDPADIAGVALPDSDLFLLQVYEIFEGEEPTMSNPVTKRSRVGVQEVKIYPWNGTTGPYDGTTECELRGLQELGMSRSSKSATVTGGETVHTLGAFETSREIKVKVSSAISDLRAIAILLGGDFVVDPASGGLGEVQYFSENLEDRAPYFRLKAKSTNGDGSDSFVYFKCKLDGDVTFNLQKDQVSNLEFSFFACYDGTAARQNGKTGGVSEWLYGEKGEVALHS